ncbi:MAG: hypothetical protein Ct9H300mP14_11340 [Gammaproteobacteria bacterium]|nr:MAG: hypothetical protein Ct9H300mP14_11340 [Gammaproteobacteria bacterium]
MSHLNTLTPVLFEKKREESGHDCGGKGRVGPVVHGPGIGGSALVGLHRGFFLPAGSQGQRIEISILARAPLSRAKKEYWGFFGLGDQQPGFGILSHK